MVTWGQIKFCPQFQNNNWDKSCTDICLLQILSPIIKQTSFIRVKMFMFFESLCSWARKWWIINCFHDIWCEFIALKVCACFTVWNTKNSFDNRNFTVIFQKLWHWRTCSVHCIFFMFTILKKCSFPLLAIVIGEEQTLQQNNSIWRQERTFFLPLNSCSKARSFF